MRNYFIIFILLFTIVGCTEKKNSSDKPTITVTIEPLRYFTQAIAGEKFNIVSMVPEGLSPESYDPTPQQLVNLNKSIAYFKIGYIGFEQIWMDKIQENNPNLKIFDTSKGITLIREEEEHHKEEIHEGHHHGGVDPHIWNSTTNATIISQNIYKALCEISPKDKNYFSSKLDSMTVIFRNINTQIKDLLANADSTFLIYHPALSYYAKQYGLKQICIEEDGKEPTPVSLKRLIDNSKVEKPHIIFIQKEFDTRNAKLIADELNLNIVSINPLSYNWIEEMLKPAKSLKKYE